MNVSMSDLIEVMTSAAIVTIVTIMTIALPVIITSMHKLVELYKTNYVMSIFNSDKALVWFRWLLVFAVSIAIAWVILFFVGCNCWFYWVSIALCIATLALMSSMIILVARVVYYTLPNKFIQIVFDKIRESKAPNFYFDPIIYTYSRDKKEEKKRLKKYYKTEEYDEESTILFIVLARVYVSVTEESIRKNILEFWEEICRNASLQANGFKYYTNCFYNFIHEIEDWTIDHQDTKLQKDAIKFTNILLSAHLPKPRKLGEPENNTDERMYVTYNTRKSLWKTIRRSVDLGSEEMFQKYWQIVNNMCSRKYESLIRYSNPKDFSNEQVCMDILHYSCCAYLIAVKKYDLLKYVLNYSQTSPFHWQLLPEKIGDIIVHYTFTKQAYADMQYEMDFTFSDDYNLYDEKKACFPIEQLTILLLYYRWAFKTEGEPSVEIQEKEEKYIQNLIEFAKAYPDSFNWVKSLGLDEFAKYKDEIVQYLQNLISQVKNGENRQAEQRHTESEGDSATSINTCTQILTSILTGVKNIWDTLVLKKEIKNLKM